MSEGYRLGLRQTQADFEAADFIAPGLSTTRRPGALTFDYLTAFCLGPVEIGDNSLGAVERPWRVRVDGGTVYVAKSNDARDSWEEEIALFTFEGEPILEVDIAFDQNARPVICAERATGGSGESVIWLYWFNPSLADFAFESLGLGWSPRILLDNPPDPADSDVLVFFFRTNSGLVYLKQRDLYEIEIATPVDTWENRFLEDVFYTKWGRMAAVYSVRSSSDTYTLNRIETTLLPLGMPGEDAITLGASIISGTLVVVLISYEDATPEGIVPGLSLVGGNLVDPIITQDQFVEDGVGFGLSIFGGSLILPIIEQELPAEDGVNVALGIESASMTVVVITHTTFAEDGVAPTLTIIGGSLAVP